MNKDMPASQGAFLETKEYRRFVEFCDACRQQRYIGLCHGFPGVGKTLSAWQYAQWHLIQPYFPERFYLEYRMTYIERVIAETIATNHVLLPPEIRRCRSILYTPPVANTPKRVEQEIGALRLALSSLLGCCDLERSQDDHTRTMPCCLANIRAKTWSAVTPWDNWSWTNTKSL